MSRISLLVVLCGAAACATARVATAPAPRMSGTVPLQMTVRGSGYSGTATFTDGLRGTFTVAGAVEVKGTLDGKATADTLTLDLTYAIAANNCRGSMKLTGAFAARGSSSAQGAVEAMDSCVGRMTGTFRIGQ